MPTPRQTPTPKGRNLVPLQEGADHLHISARTLRRWISEGRVAGYRMGPRFLRVDLDELDRQATHEIPTARAE